jgi:hypothetical protein
MENHLAERCSINARETTQWSWSVYHTTQSIHPYCRLQTKQRSSCIREMYSNSYDDGFLYYFHSSKKGDWLTLKEKKHSVDYISSIDNTKIGTDSKKKLRRNGNTGSEWNCQDISIRESTSYRCGSSIQIKCVTKEHGYT